MVAERRRRVLQLYIEIASSSMKINSIRFEKRHLLVYPSNVLVDVGAVLGAIVAVGAPETGLVKITVRLEVSQHTVLREKAVRASWTVEPSVRVVRISSWKKGTKRVRQNKNQL